MTSRRLLFTLTGFNLVLLLFLLAGQIAPALASPPVAGVLRGRGLEIIDEHGQVRASIEILPADSTIAMPDGTKGSPETVLFRLRSSTGRPNVKVAATEDGSGMVLGGDAGNTYVQIRARGASTLLRLSQEDRPARLITP